MSAQIDSPETVSYVKITSSDAEKLRDRVRAMKRAALNIQTNAKAFAEQADSFDKLLSLIIEPDEPCV